MARHKTENKLTGRIIFGAIIAVFIIIGIMASGDNEPKTQTITKVLEHEALKK